jgi:hypothetical protein
LLHVNKRSKKRDIPKDKRQKATDLLITGERHTSIIAGPIVHPTDPRSTRHGWRRGLGFDEYLDKAKFALVEYLVQFSHVREWDSVSYHERRVELPGDDIVVEDFLPVRVDWG